jgi:Ca2+-binding RTX toxin-like protein
MGMKRVFLLLTVMAAALVVASGVGLAATFNGTDHADRLVGTAKGDTIKGYGGGDTMIGKGSADTIRGYAGNDTTDGESGTDTLVGGPGNDRIFDSSGNNNRIYARDDEQDLICIAGGSGEIVKDRQDRHIPSRSC